MNEARLFLEGQRKGRYWISERQGKEKRVSYDHVPDGVWLTSRRAAIEVELSRKEEAELRGNLYNLEASMTRRGTSPCPDLYSPARVLLRMKLPDDRKMKEQLHVFMWYEDAVEWKYKGNDIKVCEEPPAV